MQIGNQKGSKSDVVLQGPSMLEQHAVITCEKDQLRIRIDKAKPEAKVLVNGQPVASSVSAPVSYARVVQQDIYHNDRILFGTMQLYVFENPIECHKNKTSGMRAVFK
jgi:hypothetical protein